MSCVLTLNNVQFPSAYTTDYLIFSLLFLFPSEISYQLELTYRTVMADSTVSVIELLIRNTDRPPIHMRQIIIPDNAISELDSIMGFEFVENEVIHFKKKMRKSPI